MLHAYLLCGVALHCIGHSIKLHEAADVAAVASHLELHETLQQIQQRSTSQHLALDMHSACCISNRAAWATLQLKRT